MRDGSAVRDLRQVHLLQDEQVEAVRWQERLEVFGCEEVNELPLGVYPRVRLGVRVPVGEACLAGGVVGQGDEPAVVREAPEISSFWPVSGSMVCGWWQRMHNSRPRREPPWKES